MADPNDVFAPQMPYAPVDPAIADEFMRSWKALGNDQPDSFDPFAPPPAPPPTSSLPGMGVPASVVEQAPPPAEPPVEEHQPPPTVQFGQPRPVSTPMPTDEALAVGARTQMQPGLGIPVTALEQSWNALAPQPVDPYEQTPLDPYAQGDETDDEIEMPPEYHRDADLNADQQLELGRRDPASLLRYYADKEGAAAEKYAAKQYDLARETHERAKASHDRYLAANEYADRQSAQVEADAREVAKRKIDPEKWWADRSTPQKIAGFIAAIMGGLVQSRRGGSNMGVDMIDKAIEQDIAAQSANLAADRAEIGRRSGVVADLYARNRDRSQAENTARIAAYDIAIDELKAEAMKYSAGSTRQQRAAGAVLAFEEKKAAALAAQKERNFEQYMRVDERNRKWAETEATIAKSAAETKKLLAKGTGSGGGPKYSADYLEKTFGVRPPPGIPGMTLKEYMPLLNASGMAQDIQKGKAEGIIKATEARVAQSGAGGSPYAVGDQEGDAYTTLVDGKEKAFEIKDDARRLRIEEINKAAQNGRRIADLVKILRAKGGGASKIVGSPEYDELVALAAAVDFETYSGFHLGAPSAGDKAMAENARGGRDITSFIYDPTPGFEAYARNLESKLNTELYSAGRKGPPIKFKKVEAAQAEERSQIQNLDVYDAPEISQAKDPEIRKRAAERAAEAAPALARQSEPEMLVIMAQKNQERMRAGLIDRAKAYEVQNALRKEYAKRARAASDGFQPPAARDAFGRSVAEARFGGKPTDEQIDQAMGVNLESGE